MLNFLVYFLPCLSILLSGIIGILALIESFKNYENSN